MVEAGGAALDLAAEQAREAPPTELDLVTQPHDRLIDVAAEGSADSPFRVREVDQQRVGFQPFDVTRDLGKNLVSWVLGCVLIYSALFCIGELCFGRYQTGFLLAIVAIVCGLAISRLMPKPAEWRAS